MMAQTGLEFQALGEEEVADIRERSIFELGKWDQQYKDKAVFAPHVLTLQPATYRALAAQAEELSSELFAAENAVLENPELLGLLGLPSRIIKVLHRKGKPSALEKQTRLCRFDFHPTPEGWRISEVNSDVPGGLLESDGLSNLVREYAGNLETLPHTTTLLLDAFLEAQPANSAPLALMHASAYTDDRQTMLYLQKELAQRGKDSVLVNPDNVAWGRKDLQVETEWHRGPVSHIFRFYPGEWMAELDRSTAWESSPFWNTPFMTNPLHALISQSKRFPLVWEKLGLPMTTWKALLPPTQAFSRSMLWKKHRQLFKPSLGRVGEGIYFPGLSSRKQFRQSLADWILFPKEWAVQERFEPLEWEIHHDRYQPCLGLYTVNGKAAGIYGRLAGKGMVDSEAQDIAVLLSPEKKDAARGQRSEETYS